MRASVDFSKAFKGTGQVVMLKNLFQGFRVRDEQNGHTGVLLHFNLDGLEAKAGLHRASAAGRRNEPGHP